MKLTSPRELEVAREKLRLLERMHADASVEPDGEPELREAELASLRRQMNQIKEEIARYETRYTVQR